MKYLIIGRSGTGKDTLRCGLEQSMGWGFVKSYTTRPKRFENEDTHIFISDDQAKCVPYSDKVAVTYIANGGKDCEYFATRKQVEDSDAYLIDPFGAFQLMCNMPDEMFSIIYVYPESRLKHISALVSRGDSAGSILGRMRSESSMFDSFESKLAMLSVRPSCFHNLKGVLLLSNDYASIDRMVRKVQWFSSDRYPDEMRENDLTMFEKYILK